MYERDGTTDDERMNLKLLLKFMTQEMGQRKERIESGCKSGRITFATLWTIFRPGDLGYVPDDAGDWLLRLLRTAYDESKKIGKLMDVYCWYNDYDGNRFGWTEHKVLRIIQKIKSPGDQSSLVDSLPVYPFSRLTGKPGLEDRLAERGKRFCTVQDEHLKCYHGVTWHIKDIPLDWFDPEYNDEPALWEE